jgi:hypothetical protein
VGKAISSEHKGALRVNKLRQRGSILIAAACLLFLFSGCGHRNIEMKPIEQSERDQLPTELIKLTDIYASYAVLPLSAYSTNERVFLEIRKQQKPWEALAAEETEQLKQDIYKAIGYAFDLQIDSFVLPKQADITGKITALDGNRVLVVGDAMEDSNPNAMWVTFPNEMTEELKIGYRINAWSDGMVNASYPGQTSGVQLQIVDFADGEGDVQGEITALYLDDPSIENRYIEVDGSKFRMLPYTIYQANGASGQSASLKVGSRVQVWTIGYELTDEKFVTQVNVVD